MAERRTHKGGLPISEYMHKYKMNRISSDPEYADRHYERRRSTTSKCAKKRSEEMSESYIIGLLSRDMGISVRLLRADPDLGQMIDIKRNSIAILRECKSMSNG